MTLYAQVGYTGTAPRIGDAYRNLQGREVVQVGVSVPLLDWGRHRGQVKDKTFREDLFYRINLINIHLAPLRERTEDIPPLVEHFLRQACAVNGLPIATASEEALRYLQTLPFYGNIRELKNLVERTLLMSAAPLNSGERRVLSTANFQEAYQQNPVDGGNHSPHSVGSVLTLDEIERLAVSHAIEKHQGNLSLAAKELGISRGALYRKIEKHHL